MWDSAFADGDLELEQDMEDHANFLSSRRSASVQVIDIDPMIGAHGPMSDDDITKFVDTVLTIREIYRQLDADMAGSVSIVADDVTAAARAIIALLEHAQGFPLDVFVPPEGVRSCASYKIEPISFLHVACKIVV